ncbi:ADP-ribosylation factor, putative [Trypanosoma equiperdum]|uniref:ADP-ribosylation factor, putative n=4 Tax=Trypanozoon TaxID=39700 RepID=Q38B80_TRYB2|nr:ADP-ribosylation factor-like protein [Trypanosoma brucei gambiense DAL972]XP_822768.1 ADP-ribosylation factor, putative [Trypanosoma brucei brucei TREU927]RHW68587.1 ADP-ribosylation factor [Trypanosoma brucei equiperdum]SCU65441.1 ADP-ribosylation factor, putative [Trypanosoma equiperdum]EAN77940.1 ADP-ribosylation factor, putative [Trypanosoma brucei brucei TREU927]CBH15551.1 ADP-ribosylation factor-like protein [Trypanosoma brucei gambiense DAL972]|eukprot:XP_011777815.1 ADP-ribosylation factor-like protein [Trypanosoma brucei gambiense DAL972]
MSSSEHDSRVAYCKEHNVHHLFELMASRLLVERPENPFEYLRELLVTVENSKKQTAHDPTMLPSSPLGAKDKLTKITIGTFGIENAGKTTIISALGGNIEKNPMPTVGFTPTRFQTDRCDLCIFDLGGGANFRGIWVHYFHDCHGFMFVIDSAADDAVVEESLNALRTVAQHKHVRGKPVLVLANKKDLKSSRGVEIVSEGLLEELFGDVSLYHLVPSCGIEEDPELEKGVDWLLTKIQKEYTHIDKLVESQTLEVKMEAEQKRKKLLEE